MDPPGPGAAQHRAAVTMPAQQLDAYRAQQARLLAECEVAAAMRQH